MLHRLAWWQLPKESVPIKLYKYTSLADAANNAEGVLVPALPPPHGATLRQSSSWSANSALGAAASLTSTRPSAAARTVARAAGCTVPPGLCKFSSRLASPTSW